MQNGLRKHFRYRKVTPDLLRFMRSLRNYQLNYKQIAEVCSLNPSSVQYHLDERQQTLAIARARRHNEKLAEDYYVERRSSMSHRRWMREYLRERYHNDPEFREKILRANTGGRFAD